MNIPPQSSALIIRTASVDDIPYIRDIAHKTWPIAYGTILRREQLNYMLELIYSTHSLKDQMKNHHHFYIATLDDIPVGFASFSQIESTAYKLQKLYVLPQTQKTGAGKKLLETVERSAEEMGAQTFLLNVNRMNIAQSFYKKNGYEIVQEEDIDIGNGFFMNDYVMEKKLLTGSLER